MEFIYREKYSADGRNTHTFAFCSGVSYFSNFNSLISYYIDNLLFKGNDSDTNICFSAFQFRLKDLIKKFQQYAFLGLSHFYITLNLDKAKSN